MLARDAQPTAAAARDDYRPDGLPTDFGMQADGLYRLSDDQAQEILQMRLQRLTGLEQDKIVAEYKEVMAEIDDLLGHPGQARARVDDHRRRAGRAQAGVRPDQARRAPQPWSSTAPSTSATEDLITPTDMVVTLSHSGYIKSQPLAEYRAQKRGGRGKQATATKEDDWVDQLFIANTHDYILCFSNRGRSTGSRCGKCRQGSRGSRGRPIVNMFPLQEGEKINVVLPLTGEKPQLPGRPLRVHGDLAWARSRRPRSTSSATRARPASSPSTSTRATT